MSTLLDVTSTAETIETGIRAALPTTPIYWFAGQTEREPPVPPTDQAFIVISPLFSTPQQSWNQYTHARHSVQVTACARIQGEANDLLQAAFDTLPATEYEVTTTPGRFVNQHYEYTLTARTHASGSN